jgi:predicted metalloprotease with PDZ domain
MHDGRFDTLEQVVDYYSSGVIANPYLDVEMRRSNLSLEETLELYSQENRSEKKGLPVQQLDFTPQDTADLVAFMSALAGTGWQDIGAPDSFPQ